MVDDVVNKRYFVNMCGTFSGIQPVGLINDTHEIDDVFQQMFLFQSAKMGVDP